MSSRVIMSRGTTPFVLVTCPSTKPRRARPLLLSLCRINSSARFPIMTTRTLLVALSNLRYVDDRARTDASLSHRAVPPLLVLRAFVVPRPLVGRLDVSLLLPRPPPPPLPDRWAPRGIVASRRPHGRPRRGRNWAYIASFPLIEICGNLMWKFKKLENRASLGDGGYLRQFRIKQCGRGVYGELKACSFRPSLRSIAPQRQNKRGPAKSCGTRNGLFFFVGRKVVFD